MCTCACPHTHRYVYICCVCGDYAYHSMWNSIRQCMCGDFKHNRCAEIFGVTCGMRPANPTGAPPFSQLYGDAQRNPHFAWTMQVVRQEVDNPQGQAAEEDRMTVHRVPIHRPRTHRARINPARDRTAVQREVPSLCRVYGLFRNMNLNVCHGCGPMSNEIPWERRVRSDQQEYLRCTDCSRVLVCLEE